MSLFDPYLFFDGNCADAMRFYEQTFGGKLELMPAAGTPGAEQMPPGSEHLIMHSHLDLDGRMLMASDWMAPEPYPGMKGISVSVSYPTAAEAKKIFDALSEGGQVHMPFEKTFWSDGFGMLADKFGTNWMVGSDQPQEG
ncbi:MAG TPA: VOC family protein [Thermoanaerobaculia bacterium]|nr:VOC family protein [Thermoanaerobaculia bacterium]